MGRRRARHPDQDSLPRQLDVKAHGASLMPYDDVPGQGGQCPTLDAGAQNETLEGRIAMAATKYPVVVGQIWRDTDKRRPEHFVRVIDLFRDRLSNDIMDEVVDALVQSCTPNLGTFFPKTPQVVISINRLQTRFKLYRNEANERVYHHPGSRMTSENENVNYD